MPRLHSLASQIVSAVMLVSILPANLTMAKGLTIARPNCIDLAKLLSSQAKTVGSQQVSSSSSSAKTTSTRSANRKTIGSAPAIVNVGLTIMKTGSMYYISSVAPGSAAEQAGLLPGDEIRQINGQPVGSRYSEQSMLDALNGPEGTSVKLEVARQTDGGFPIITLVRKKAIVMSDYEMKMDSGFAYVKIRAFTPSVAAAVRNWSKTPDVQKAKGVIFDVRTNPNGDVTALMSILSPFVPKGTSFGTVLTKSASIPLKTSEAPTLPAGVPVAIIVNEGGMQGIVVRYAMFIKRVPTAIVVVEGNSLGKNSIIPGGFTFGGATAKQEATQYCADSATFTWDLLYKSDVSVKVEPGKDAVLEKAKEELQKTR